MDSMKMQAVSAYCFCCYPVVSCDCCTGSFACKKAYCSMRNRSLC